jgi:hypothetical protein
MPARHDGLRRHWQCRQPDLGQRDDGDQSRLGSTTATTSRNNALEYRQPGGVYGQVVAPGNVPTRKATSTSMARLDANKAINVSGHTTSSRIDATGSRWSESD